MNSMGLPTGCYVRIDKPDLQGLLDELRRLGYRVLGPRLSQGAIQLADLESIQQMPIGWVDEQQPGRYRLRQQGSNYFDYVVGPGSLKRFLFPPQVEVLQSLSLHGSFQFTAPKPPPQPLAVIGVRACDLAAVRILDRVLLEGPASDADYRARRQSLFVLAVNCARPAATCFCASMNSGPAVTEGADLALFELPTHFVLEVGSERGGEVLSAIKWRPCSTREVAEAQQVPRQAEKHLSRALPSRERVRDLLRADLEHEHYDEIAQRCLACSNCTMSCPTCFCSSIHDTSDLSGEMCTRERLWASCFTDDHSYMNSGTVRKSIRARYRQWLTHKLSSWIDQFGTSGCVGCGRCITWCPVGIDLTAEVAALGGTNS